MQLANEIRKAKEAEKAESEAVQLDKWSETGGIRVPPPGRSPSLRPRGASLERSASYDSKSCMPPVAFVPPSKAQKTSVNGFSLGL
eukprot:2651338-Prymnesium_polylepis.1